MDIARHVSKAYAGQNQYSEAQALSRIQAGLEAELAAPTDDPQELR